MNIANQKLPELMKLGRDARLQGDHHTALSYFEKAIVQYPQDLQGYIQSIIELTHLDLFAEASQYLDHILTKHPDHLDELMNNRPNRINVLAKVNQAQSYLEIGVFKGITFNQVMIKTKVAVDPQFQFNYKEKESENIRFHEITSDEFFSTVTHQKFDLIYLDGLHTFEQTFRDFCATLSMAHEKTIWLIDDTVPSDIFASDKTIKRCIRLRRASGDKSGAWMGDVFKVVYAIHDFFPQFNYATFTGHGQTVVWRETRTKFKPRWNCLSTITNLSYLDFLDTQDEILNIKTPTEIMACLR